MTAKPFHHAVSLGANCFAAMFFKNAGYRTSAGPFDWLAADEVTALEGILAADFADFIDPAFLVDHVEGHPGKCGHAKYGPRLFHHYNPRVPEVAAYYARCVARFRGLADATRPVMLFLMANEDVVDAGRLERIHAHLLRYVPAEHLVFVACVVAPGRAERASRLETSADGTFVRWDLAVTSHNIGLSFGNHADMHHFQTMFHTYFGHFETVPADHADTVFEHRVSV